MKIKLATWFLLAVIVISFLKICHGATTLENVIERSQGKVVKIGIVQEKGGGVCSGAFISSRGIVLTCAHCFTHGGIKKVFIKTEDGTAYPAALLKLDAARDLALVVPDSIGPFPYFKFGSEPVKGQQVLSFGSPLGLQHTITVGWVTNILKQTKVFILHSAFISPGNSGGPLVDMGGRLIGVNEAMLSYGFMQVAHGLYVAIDVVTVKEFLRDAGTR